MYIPEGYAFLNRECFHRMKKNETKNARSKPPEVLAKEQAEDRTFNRMLLWLAAAVLVEVVMLLVNRYYIHARVAELGAIKTIYTLLGVAPVVGVILFVVCLAWGLHLRKQEDVLKDGMIQIVLGCALLCIGFGAFGMRLFGATGASLVLGIVPALGVLMLIFYLYQKEFFVCAIAGGLGILGLWAFRTVGSGTMYYLYLVVALVLVAVGAGLFFKLQKQDGIWNVKGKELTIFQPGAAYPAYYITAVITAVLLLAPLAIGASVAYYAIWVMSAWLFILAVYFTSKLM